MKLTTDYTALYDRIDRAHHAAAQDTLADVVVHQVKRTGKLAGSFHLADSTGTQRVTRVLILSSVVYADAVERGANARVKGSVKNRTKARTSGTKKAGTYQVHSGPVLNRASRRGPHMIGNHVVLDNGPRFLEHMRSRLAGS